MKLVEVREILKEVDGKSYTYLRAWGLSLIKESIRTIRNRRSSTKADIQLAENVSTKIMRQW